MMKQPMIKIFGEVHKVIGMEFHPQTGKLDKVVYQVNEHQRKSVFRGEEMITKSLTSTYKIQKPTNHPFHDYAYAPDLESLLIEG